MLKATYVAMIVALTSLGSIGTTYASQGTVEAEVRKYFKDIPVMVAIARCESGFVHYDASQPNGVKKNPDSSASGVLQIMLSVHEDDARVLKLNLLSLQGQLAYGRHLYEQNGTRDWKSSRDCWGKRKK